MTVSEVKTSKPTVYKNELHRRVYDTLEALGIPFERVDNDPALTMEDCVEIDRRLDVKTVKTLLLCNRQKTAFYLFVTPGDKPFVTRNFSHTLGVSRVSFAPEEKLQELLGTVLGATTVLTLGEDKENAVRLVIDREILSYAYYGCTDSTTTGYMRLRLDDVLQKIIPHTKHEPTFIDV